MTLKEYIKKGPSIVCCDTPMSRIAPIYIRANNQMYVELSLTKFDLNLIPQDADQIKTSYEDDTTKRNIEEVWTYSNFEKLKQKHGSKKVISYNIESTYSDGIEIVLKRD